MMRSNRDGFDVVEVERCEPSSLFPGWYAAFFSCGHGTFIHGVPSHKKICFICTAGLHIDTELPDPLLPLNAARQDGLYIYSGGMGRHTAKPRRCPVCNKDVALRDSAGGQPTYCSEGCRKVQAYRTRQARRPPPQPKVRRCLYCGATVVTDRVGVGRAKQLCSEDCKRNWRTYLQRRRRHGKQEVDPSLEESVQPGCAEAGN